MVKFASPGGALPRISGLPSEPRCLRPSAGGARADLLFDLCGCGPLSALLSLPCKPLLCLGLCLGRGMGFLLRRHFLETKPIQSWTCIRRCHFSARSFNISK